MTGGYYEGIRSVNENIRSSFEGAALVFPSGAVIDNRLAKGSDYAACESRFFACLFRPFLPAVYAQAPVFGIEPQESSITFHVKASTTLTGKFDKWTASLIFASPDGTTGVLEIKIEAASVDSGSGLKNGKLKNKDFFDVEQIH